MSDEDSLDVVEEYFNKALWLEYANSSTPTLPDSLRLTPDESQVVLKAYYRLLGVETLDVYGWECEYTTSGRYFSRRQATIDLVVEVEKLKKLLYYPNLYVQLYVIDALVYLDFTTRQAIAGMPHESARKMYLEALPRLLTEEEWDMIYSIRSSNQLVFVCSDSGSNQVSSTSTLEVLSEDNLRLIPANYKQLRENGHFGR